MVAVGSLRASCPGCKRARAGNNRGRMGVISPMRPGHGAHDATEPKMKELDMAFQLPELPYAYDALEPHIDARTMEIHHTRHHAGYVAKLNAALEGVKGFDGKSVEEILG